jgi:hypothetical protein
MIIGGSSNVNFVIANATTSHAAAAAISTLILSILS